MSGSIFISYRRDDSPHAAGRLYEYLAQSFPRDQLFMDVDTIEPGLDFTEVIKDKVAACEVLLAVIGPGWSAARNEDGERRLDDPNDFVRLEIEAALERNVRVIPVLVDGGRIPKTGELPESLKSLVKRHAIQIAHERFASDASRLIGALQRARHSAEAEERQRIEEAKAQQLPEERRLQAEAKQTAAEEQRREQAEAEIQPRAVQEQAGDDLASLKASPAAYAGSTITKQARNRLGERLFLLFIGGLVAIWLIYLRYGNDDGDLEVKATDYGFSIARGMEVVNATEIQKTLFSTKSECLSQCALLSSCGTFVFDTKLYSCQLYRRGGSLVRSSAVSGLRK
jgi:hypothetical protein